MKLSALTKEYVASRRALGSRFDTAEIKLKTFCKEVGDIDIQEVSADAIREFVGRRNPAYAGQCVGLLRGFYRFAVKRDYVANPPQFPEVPRRVEKAIAHIYSTEEIERLLAATSTLARPSQPLRALTFRTLLLILYGTGIRVGEALKLTLRDVDFSARILTIRDSKFFKTRLVPFGPRLSNHLARYRKKRLGFPLPDGDDSFFFCGDRGRCRGRGLYVGPTDTTFRKLCAKERLQSAKREGFGPRLHDLRHTFAVHRVVQWYRDDADVQSLLPLLATYLGHVGIGSTQRYLTMTPDLLEKAGARFAGYALSETKNE